MSAAAVARGDGMQAERWSGVRTRLLHGINANLTIGEPDTRSRALGNRSDERGSTEFVDQQTQIYAELLGHHSCIDSPIGGYHCPPNSTGPMALLPGYSFPQQAIAAAFSSVLDSSILEEGNNHSMLGGRSSAADTGLDVARMDATLAAYTRSASFLWLADGDGAAGENGCSLLVPNTFVNGSARDDKRQSSNVVIGKGLGWEIAWAAYRKDWQRLTVLHRWLGAAA